MLSDADPGSSFCAFCGKALGVYEPLVVIGRDRSALRTSRLMQRETPIPGVLVHEDCYAKHQPWSEETSA
jgi:hypothetical protein